METGPFRLSSRALRRSPSPIRELMPYLRQEGMISFGGGYPNPETFAFESMRVRLTRDGGEVTISGADMVAASQYGATEGLPALRAELRRWLFVKNGVEVPEAGMTVVNGNQEGIYLAGDVLLDEGDEAVVTEPTYPGALAAFRSFSEGLLAIPIDAEGIRTKILAEALAEREREGRPLPKLIYAIPNGDNPAGTTLSLSRRKALVALAVRYDIPIVEDDPYELIRLHDHPPLPCLYALAPSHVLRLDSLSKILCPGLRLGCVSGPPQLVRALNLHKQASNLHTSTFAQAVLLAYLRQDGPEGLLARVATNVALYRRNRDAFVEAATRILPDDVVLDVPEAGLFLWITLPEGFDGQRMVDQDCADLGVLLVPGAAFSTCGGLRNALRASFSMIDPRTMETGVRRLAEMIRRERERVSAGRG